MVLAAVAAPLAAVSATAPHAAAATTACPWVDSTAPISTRVSELMAQMSLSQKIDLMTGASGSSYVGNIPAISSLCIPAINLEDGPAGVGDGMSNVTQLPAPVDVAATWDTSAEQEYGHVIGAEQAAKGTTVDLGPTINIVRDPRWGRAFESIGEDPYLVGQMSAADIRGVQSAGTMAQVKHYAVYNQETNRNTPSDNAIVSTQAEQEIYLPAFQAAVQQGAASSVMCSYSTINGTYACQNPYTLTTVLRQQFGYTGFVTSDWGATHSTAASANAGLDMDMPGNDGFYGTALVNAVNSGSVQPGDDQLGRVGHPDPDVRLRPVRQGAERIAVGGRDELHRPERRDAASRRGHGAAEELRRCPAAYLVRQVDRGHRGGRLDQPADRRRRQRRGELQRHRHPAAGHPGGRAQRHDRHLQQRLLRQFGRVGGRGGQRRDRLRQPRRVRGLGPVQHRPGHAPTTT